MDTAILTRLQELLRVPLQLSKGDCHSVLDTVKPTVEERAHDGDPCSSEIAQTIEALGQSDSAVCHARALWISGNIHLKLRLPDLALNRYEQAGAIYRDAGRLIELARMHIGKTYALLERRQFRDALDCGLEAGSILASSLDTQDQSKLSSLHENLGAVYDELGDYDEALAYYRRRLAWLKQHVRLNDPDAIYIPSVLNNISLVESNLGRYYRAKLSYEAALTYLTRLEQDNETLLDTARVYMNLARLEILRDGSKTNIQNYFACGCAIRDRLNSDSAQRELANLDLYEAKWLLQTGQYTTVNRERLSLLRDLCVREGILREASHCELLLGQLSFIATEFDTARQQFERVVESARASSEAGIRYAAQTWLARAHRAQGQVAEAESILKSTLAEAEEHRRRIHQNAIDARSGFLDDKLVTYHELTSLYLDGGEVEKALGVVERIKTLSLMEARVDVGSEVGQATATTATEFLFTDSENIHHICAALPQDCLIISYAVVHADVWGFLLDRTGILGEPKLLGKAPDHNDIEQLLRRITPGRRINSSQSLRSQLVTAKHALQKWHTLLLEPFASTLAKYRRIVISPDGVLNHLPFACLYDSHADTWLAETHEVMVSPGLAFNRLLDDLSVAPVRALVMGYSPPDDPLPGAEPEATFVASQFGSDLAQLHTGRHASRDVFFKQAPDAGFIHIAAHARFNPNLPGSSYTRLSDGRLRASEIAALRLSNPFVSLSACETGSGVLSGNESLGLVHAFLCAGAHSVLATHWPVDDLRTFNLMKALVGEFRSGKSASYALSKAQHGFIFQRDSPECHPFFWGAFALQGKL